MCFVIILIIFIIRIAVSDTAMRKQSDVAAILAAREIYRSMSIRVAKYCSNLFAGDNYSQIISQFVRMPSFLAERVVI